MRKLKILKKKNNSYLYIKKNMKIYILKKPIEIKESDIIIDDFCIIITFKEFKQQNIKWYDIFINELKENKENFIEVNLNDFENVNF